MSGLAVELLKIDFCSKQELDELSRLVEQTTKLQEFQTTLQFSITSSDGSSVFDGIGSLYNYETQQFIGTTQQFIKINSIFKKTFFEELMLRIKSVAEQNQVQIGRSRLMRLKQKTCLSLHSDPDEFRFHIPLKTNDKCFFVVGDHCYRMPKVGSLYLLQTKELHTAVNASFEIRDHFVFDTFKI